MPLFLVILVVVGVLLGVSCAYASGSLNDTSPIMPTDYGPVWSPLAPVGDTGGLSWYAGPDFGPTVMLPIPGFPRAFVPSNGGAWSSVYSSVYTDYRNGHMAGQSNTAVLPAVSSVPSTSTAVVVYVAEGEFEDVEVPTVYSTFPVQSLGPDLLFWDGGRETGDSNVGKLGGVYTGGSVSGGGSPWEGIAASLDPSNIGGWNFQLSGNAVNDNSVYGRPGPGCVGGILVGIRAVVPSTTVDGGAMVMDRVYVNKYAGARTSGYGAGAVEGRTVFLNRDVPLGSGVASMTLQYSAGQAGFSILDRGQNPVCPAPASTNYEAWAAAHAWMNDQFNLGAGSFEGTSVAYFLKIPDSDLPTSTPPSGDETMPPPSVVPSGVVDTSGSIVPTFSVDTSGLPLPPGFSEIMQPAIDLVQKLMDKVNAMIGRLDGLFWPWREIAGWS